MTNDKTTGPRINAISPLTPKPGTKTAANQKQRPLTIKEKVPKLRKLRGKDKVEMTGLTDELIAPTAAAAIKAAGKLAILTPGTTISTTSKLSAVAKIVKAVLNIKIPPI